MAESVRIARMGSFYAGGRQVRIEGEPVRDIAFTRTASLTYDPNGLYHFEQAYVQYFVPETLVSPLPLVLLHGGGFTGAMWETTPDGRPGWLQIFLELGFAVYVVDNVERGRAGWCPFPQVWPGEPIIRTAEEVWSLFRFGSAANFSSREPFPELQFPVSALDELIKGCVPRWQTNNDAAVETFRSVLDQVGKCVVVTHSHGGEIAFRAAEQCPELVPKIIAVEPSGFAQRLGAYKGRDVLILMGDFLEATPLWIQLTNKVQDFSRLLEDAGCAVDLLFLKDLNIRGNSHMMMMDTNNQWIAETVAKWIRREEDTQGKYSKRRHSTTVARPVE
ncbi:alpha/beta fold hydrolase [Aurantimonas sp. VKM B-3413]|uniref:alpha/beta fold hydrolase n=1 Tax=Aurantimonas sp. VKM B-3413 TaxID=2779401 RepID=UPI001E6560DC|nr:alpha/beta fold hydrolase [Aurantimonas sp. VKM B-3413]MCB8837010.1 alpha/beta fold hydrolase [Aurantimonas sp. VKM B-3413]